MKQSDIIDFLEVRIVNTIFEINDNYESPDDHKINYDMKFVPEFLINRNDEKDGLVSLKATFFDEDFQEKNKPFFLKLEVRGHFVSKDEKPLSDYSINCLNIMVPYIRSYVTTFTSLAGMEPVNFPPINIYDMFEETENN